jgi:hypothetical protein
MVRHLAQGSTSSSSSPLLDVWISNGKVLVDPDPGSLHFSVYDISTEEKEADGGVLVFGPHAVDLTADRLSLDALTNPPEPGHFAAAWSVSGSEPTGAHEIRWSWTYTTVPPATSDTETRSYGYVQRFDVLAGVPRGLGGGYALVSDFRAEEYEPEMVSDVRLLRLISEQSADFDTLTQRFFEPRFIDVSVDGTDARSLLVGHPIIALDGVAILDDPIAIDPTSREIVIYNRHLAGMTDPDDRDAPRVEIPETYGLIDPWGGVYAYSYPWPPLRMGFPKSSQNIHVQGLFGYTDADGSTIGQTPAGVKRAVMLMVKRNMPRLACDNELFDARMSGRAMMLRTRDQSVSYASAGLGEGEFTGDLDLDRAIGRYRRPARCGAT